MCIHAYECVHVCTFVHTHLHAHARVAVRFRIIARRAPDAGPGQGIRDSPSVSAYRTGRDLVKGEVFEVKTEIRREVPQALPRVRRSLCSPSRSESLSLSLCLSLSLSSPLNYYTVAYIYIYIYIYIYSGVQQVLSKMPLSFHEPPSPVES